jgi:hypothetical protein
MLVACPKGFVQPPQVLVSLVVIVPSQRGIDLCERQTRMVLLDRFGVPPVSEMFGGCAGDDEKAKGHLQVVDSDGSTTEFDLTEQNTSVSACFGQTCSEDSFAISFQAPPPTAASLDLFNQGIPRVGSAPLAAEQLEICLRGGSNGSRCIYGQGTLTATKSEINCGTQCCVLDLLADLTLVSDGSLRPAHQETGSTTTRTPAVPFDVSGTIHIDVHQSRPVDGFSDEGFFTGSC